MNAKDILRYIEIQKKIFKSLELRSDYSRGLIDGLEIIENYINMLGEHG